MKTSLECQAKNLNIVARKPFKEVFDENLLFKNYLYVQADGPVLYSFPRFLHNQKGKIEYTKL